MIRRWLAYLLACSLVFACAPARSQTVEVPAPQTAPFSEYVTGWDDTGVITSKQVDFADLSFYGVFGAVTNSNTEATIPGGTGGNVTLYLNDTTNFAVNYTVQVRSQEDPQAYFYAIITALDTGSGATTMAVTIAPFSGTFQNWTVQVVAGPSFGLPASSSAGIIAATFSVPAIGDTVSQTTDAGKLYQAGDTVYVASIADYTAAFVATVVTYNTSTGAAVLFVRQISGSGSNDVWTISTVDKAGADAALVAYSTTSFAMATGSKTFTIQSSKFFPVGSSVFGTALATPTEHFSGFVTAYSGTSLTLFVTSVTGSSTFTAWSIYDTSGQVVNYSAIGTSSSTVSVPTTPTGVSFTTQTGLSFLTNSLAIAYSVDGSKYLYGFVDTYNTVNGLMSFVVNAATGSGSASNWIIVQQAGPLSYTFGGQQAGLSFSARYLGFGLVNQDQTTALTLTPTPSGLGGIITLDTGGADVAVTFNDDISFPTITQGDLLYGSAAGVLSALTKNTTATRYLSNTGSSNNPAWAQVALTTGVSGTLPVGNGGTGLTTFTQGDLIYSSAADTLAKLAKNTSATRYLSNTGASNNPAWAQVDLTTGVTGVLPAVNGGASAPPGGRLTLTTATPVLTSTVSGATTVFYTPYNSQFVPLYDGTNFTNTSTGGELSQTTADATKSPAAVTNNGLYNVYVWSDSGTIRATRGPLIARTTATITVTIATPAVVTWTAHGFAQGQPVIFTTTGALPAAITAGTTYYVLATSIAADTFRISATVDGAAINTTGGSQSGVHTGTKGDSGTPSGELTRVNGILLNTSTITNGPAASRGTYVGTIRSNASSQIDHIYGAIGALCTQGSFGIWNYYNRKPLNSFVQDSTNSWTYTTATWRPGDGSALCSVQALTGVAEDSVAVQYNAASSNNSAAGTSVQRFVGIGLNSTTAIASGSTGGIASTYDSQITPMTGSYVGTPASGFNVFTAIERSVATSTTTWYGDNNTPTTTQTGMTYQGQY